MTQGKDIVIHVLHLLRKKRQEENASVYNPFTVVVDPETGHKYGVKSISFSLCNIGSKEESDAKHSAVVNEGLILRICRHFNIATFHGNKRFENHYHFVFDYYEGGDLSTIMERRKRIPLEACRYAIAELFSAVFYLHSGKETASPGAKQEIVLHRDIKPENIVLSADYHVKLIDFGTAKALKACEKGSSDSTPGARAGTVCGTSCYMSPELLELKQTCPASDYWGCGCVLYFLLTGRPPFSGPNAHAEAMSIMKKDPIIPPSVDPEAADLVKKLLIKKFDKRIGINEIRKHPFFSTVDFDTLPRVNMKALWMEETPWKDELEVIECYRCKTKYESDDLHHYCRSCGHLCCVDCCVLSVLESERYNSVPQHVCKACDDRIHSKQFLS